MLDNIPEISFKVAKQGTISWHRLLREGVDVEIKAGRSVEELLHEELNIDLDTIREQIKTIFLNQKPVDDLQTTVPDRALLTLSGAMPGFLGACMRVNSPYARMRESISAAGNSDANRRESDSYATVSLKIFNILVPEIAPQVLQKGILISRERFADHVENLPEEFWKSCHHIKVNRQNASPADVTALLQQLQDSDKLRVFVQLA